MTNRAEPNLLFGFAWCDVKWRPRWTEGFGENIHPHLKASLQKITIQKLNKCTNTQENTVTVQNLREIRLKGAEERPGLHMFRDKSLFSEHVQTESFPGWTQVLVDFHVVLWM